MTSTIDISELQSYCAQSVSITYNANAADSLSFQLKPEAYKELDFHYGEKLQLKDGDRFIFSGTVNSVSCSVQAGSGETVNVEAVSDYSLLERTAYVKMDSEGNMVYPSVGKNEKFTSLKDFIVQCADFALPEASVMVELDAAKRVPAPEGNGITSCGALIMEATRWAPEVVMVNRYPLPEGQMLFTTTDQLESLAIGEDALLTSVQLQARPELVPPVCALVGGYNYKVPNDGSLRQPGCFIFPVPVDRDENARAGSSPASQKMTLKGIAVPEGTVGKNGAAVYKSADIREGTRMHKFLSYFFPQYKEVLLYSAAAAPLLTIVPKEELEENDPGEDEDSVEPPANYSDPLGWGSGDGYDNCFVLTEGSFTASSRRTKNLRGLKWCKGTISVNLSMSQEQYAALPRILKPGIDTLFPGRNRRLNKAGTEYVSHKLVNLKLDCVFINSRKRIYDPATNQPCSTDSEYDDSTALTESDYVSAMNAYYAATRNVYHEGSITMLHDGSLHPEQLTGRSLTIQGKRDEWAGMNAIVRSVTWEYQARTLSLSVGPREVMGFNDILQRKLMAKAPRRELEQRNVTPFDVNDKEAQKAQESEMSVSPSISASTSGAVSGKYRQPFTLYQTFEAAGAGEEDKVTTWMAGGTLRRGGQVFNVPDSDKQIMQGSSTSVDWKIDGGKLKLKWTYTENGWKYSITQ